MAGTRRTEPETPLAVCPLLKFAELRSVVSDGRRLVLWVELSEFREVAGADRSAEGLLGRCIDLGLAVVLRGVSVFRTDVAGVVCANAEKAAKRAIIKIEVRVRIAKVITIERFWWTNVLKLKQESAQ